MADNLSYEFPPGTQVNWWSFSSCTNEPAVLENSAYLGNSGDRTLFSVEAINGRKIDGHSHFVEENEVLLPGTQMIVQSQFSPAENLHIIHLKQVIPEATLLEKAHAIGIAKRDSSYQFVYRLFCSSLQSSLARC